MPLRLAHFSDIHLTATPLRLAARDWFGKRASGWFNTRMGRGKHFRDASKVAGLMADDLRARAYDHIIFSGDATTLGLYAEFEEVERVLHPDHGWPPALAVPGNHDYYTRRAAKSREFERVFAPWQHGERIGEHTYPFAQKAGPLWLVGVNSSDANILHWDSRGRVGVPQLERLRELLARLPAGPRVLVTHYPLILDSGRPETRWRKLRDVVDLKNLAVEGGVKLWLHGHRHKAYFHPADETLPFPVVCVGSATQTGRWSFNEYTFAEGVMSARRRAWDPVREKFVDGDEFQMPLSIE
ncbi:MAG TPA: metallophosphoesterase [Gemmataceae bacterium]|jgi:3',5'-cyclic AMP phosphodiesterase CpdA|nr:metallophosphoesterase [Gemmataceae bacterium]